MSTDLRLASGSTAERYEALLRISEALSACGEPEELSRILADQLNGVIHFDHLHVLVLKENSKEVEWYAWGKGPLPLLWDKGTGPLQNFEDLPNWQVYN